MHKDCWYGKRLGVIGAGNMAEALVRGALAGGVISGDRIYAYDPLPARRGVFTALGCVASDSPRDAAGCEAVLLSVKPQTVREAVAAVKPMLNPDALVISIAAGLPVAVLQELLHPENKLVRVMPNTPLLVGRGMSALARAKNVADADMDMAISLFAAAGDAVEVEERLLDAVTALSGSGPAYIFRFTETLIAGGQKLGLPAGLSKRLALATVIGAAEMLAAGGEPAELRDRVTSPGGTTAAALGVFEANDFEGIVAQALAAAKARGEELGRKA